MSAAFEIINALRVAGIQVTPHVPESAQGSVLSVGTYPHPIRLYAWQVTDNGRATGTARPADERRIQAIGSRTQVIEASANPETVVLGWCDEFGTEPLIVAFNPYRVALRVNGKVRSKMNAGVSDAPPVSDYLSCRLNLRRGPGAVESV